MRWFLSVSLMSIRGFSRFVIGVGWVYGYANSSNKTMKRQAVALVVLLLVGCAGRGPTRGAPPPTDADIADAKVELHCKTESQCGRWWKTAQVWVVKNSGMKLQIATDAILDTYNPSGYVSGWGVLVTRSPSIDGGEIIDIRAACRPAASCALTEETFIANFKRAVLGTR